jgi:hypothetical protein
MNLVLERIEGDAATENPRSPRALSGPIVSRVQLSAVVRSVYVSQALRDHDDLRLVFDVAPEDLDFTVRTLHQVLPEAVVEGVRPRFFTHRGRQAQA